MLALTETKSYAKKIVIQKNILLLIKLKNSRDVIHVKRKKARIFSCFAMK